MSQPAASSPAADDYVHDDVQAVSEYRSVSGMAVLSLVLGVVSLAALVTSTLLIVPLLGVIFAMLAIRKIAASEGRLVGRTVAILGLGLSLAIGAGVYVRDATVNSLIASQGEQWALEWCELVRDGELATAAELGVGPEVRQPFDDQLNAYYATDEEAIKRMEAFKNDAVIRELMDAPEGSRVVPGDVLLVEPDGLGGYAMIQAFELVPPAGEGNPSRFQLTLRRARLAGLGGSAWLLVNRAAAE